MAPPKDSKAKFSHRLRHYSSPEATVPTAHEPVLSVVHPVRVSVQYCDAGC